MDFSYLHEVLAASHKAEKANIHRKYDSSAHDQSRQPRERTGPECKHAFILEDPHSTHKAVLIVLARLNRLHSGGYSAFPHGKKG